MAVKTNYSKFFNLEEIVEIIRSYRPAFDQSLFVKAFNFAEEAHRGQMRKDGETPYIAHPVEVVKILAQIHADEDVLIAALLHDVPEDTPRTIEEVREEFGNSIGFLVDGITKLSKVQYKNEMPLRQVESLKKLFIHSAEDVRVILIKLADRLHNMTTLENIDKPDKRIRIARETLEIYVPIANLLGIHILKKQLEDYCFKHLFPIEYEALHKKLDVCDKNNQPLYEHFTNSLKRLLTKSRISSMIQRKNRNYYSIYKKLCSEGKSIDDADGRFAVLIVVSSTDMCYKVLGLLHGQYTPKPGRFKDYIANPKPNGYQSLHTTVFGPDGLAVRIQIMSKSMYRDAEYGIAANYFQSPKKKKKTQAVFLLNDKRTLWVNKVTNIDEDSEGKRKNMDAFLEDLKVDILHDRIVVFTPKGDPVDLPDGATALDFAYAIHSDLGDHARKVEINSVSKPISQQLKTGDVITINTDENQQPELSWLSFVKTNVAKKKIRDSLKKLDQKDKLRKGRKKLQKSFDIAELGIYSKMSHKQIRRALSKQYNRDFETAKVLQVAVAEGSISGAEVTKAIKNNLSIFDCIRGMFRRKNFDGETKFNLKIVADNRFGLLNDVSERLYKYALDMNYLKGWASRSKKRAYFNAQIIVDDIEKVGLVFDELQQIEGVHNVYSMSTKGFVLFWTLATLLGISWIAHPFIVNRLSEWQFVQDHAILSSYLLNIGILVLIFGILALSHLAKKYFPVVRNAKLIWLISSLIGIVAGVTLFIEITYFNLNLNWFALVLELSAIYVYLIMSYVNFRRNESV